MKEIMLSQGKIAIVDDCDFEIVNKYKWTYLQTGIYGEYAYRSAIVDGKRGPMLLHRFILGEVPKDMVIDHINGNGLDNRRENLRICTRSQNNINKRKKGTSSKYKGVYFDKARNKFRSHIIVEGKSIFLGRYETELEAALAYDKASNKYHGEFANNNNL
jgi:HNH endonuclease/AP2 domain